MRLDKYENKRVAYFYQLLAFSLNKAIKLKYFNSNLYP